MAPWVKLDDCFSEHPKVEEAGDLAAWLYVCGLQYCSRALSDGFIPASRVPRLTGLQRPLKLAETLVAVGLWERVEGGFQVHDYAEHQRTAEQVKRDRQRTSERVTRFRAKRSSNTVGNGPSNAVTNGDVTAVDTDRDTETPQSPPRGASVEDAEFRDWLHDHEQVTSRRAPKPGTQARAALAKAYGARRRERYSADELKLASRAAHANDYRRENGYDKAESVLRPQKVHDLVEDGRRRFGNSPAQPRETIDEERERKLREQLL